MATLSRTPANLPAPPTIQTASAPIVLDGLTHNYGDRLALDRLSFDVKAGEIFGLLGPNGSGKTTLFRILSTLMTPTGGNASIQGFDVAREPNKVRQQIGIVFQARSVDLKLTVAENLKHQGNLYGLSGARLKSRIDDVLGRVGLLDRKGDFVETLSGGMQRRVELAKGLIHSPSILLLDEPSTGLDPGARRDLWQYLETLRDEEGVAILVTTHLMEEAEHCDRLAILNEGKLVALGSPFDLKSQIGGDVVLFEVQIRKPRKPSRSVSCSASASPLRPSKLLSVWNRSRAIASSPPSSRPSPESSNRSLSPSPASKMSSSDAPVTASGPKSPATN